jgi:nitroimidazol reductase NimA-like FMN-containing flavoprotein (pyridoxamine 5'-phosphate oxidase superfamily)
MELGGEDLDRPGKNGLEDSDITAEVVERIRGLAEGQQYGVLCTQIDGQPYGSMIALAFTQDLCHAVFSTPRATRKYNNLIECDKVAIVVNDLDKSRGELMQVTAFTATGRAREVDSEEDQAEWAGLLVRRHPKLKSFIASPSTAIFKVEIVRFICVHSFQEVMQWVPSSISSEPSRHGPAENR